MILLATAFAVSVLGAWLLLSQEGSSGDALVGDVVGVVAKAAPGTEERSTARRTATKSLSATQLPPPDVPLQEVFDDLAEAADAGHAAAACRLAWDLQRCQRLDARATIPAFYVERAAGAPADSAEEGGFIEEVVAAETRLEHDRTVCEGLAPDRLDQAARRLLQAAQLGHPASQAMFASWPPFGQHLSLEEAEVALFHRDHAMELLRSAAAHGEPAALFGLFHACHFGEIRLMHGTIDVGRDPVCAMATAIALRDFADAQTASDVAQVIRESAAALDPEGQGQARERAEFYRQRFEGRPQFDFAGGVFRNHLRAPCADLAATSL